MLLLSSLALSAVAVPLTQLGSPPLNPPVAEYRAGKGAADEDDGGAAGDVAAGAAPKPLPLAKDFYESHMRANKPAVLRGAAAGWPALERWKDEKYVDDALDGYEVLVEHTPTPGLWTRTTTYAADSASYRQRTASEPNNWRMIDALPGPLQGDVSLPPFAACGSFEVESADWWVSRGGWRVPLGAEPIDNLFCQVRGSTSIFLGDPSASLALGIDAVTGLSDIAVADVDESTHPAAKGAPAETVTLAPGDCLYIPGGWPHHLEAARGRHTAIDFYFASSGRHYPQDPERPELHRVAAYEEASCARPATRAVPVSQAEGHLFFEYEAEARAAADEFARALIDRAHECLDDEIGDMGDSHTAADETAASRACFEVIAGGRGGLSFSAIRRHDLVTAGPLLRKKHRSTTPDRLVNFVLDELDVDKNGKVTGRELEIHGQVLDKAARLDERVASLGKDDLVLERDEWGRPVPKLKDPELRDSVKLQTRYVDGAGNEVPEPNEEECARVKGEEAAAGAGEGAGAGAGAGGGAAKFATKDDLDEAALRPDPATEALVHDADTDESGALDRDEFIGVMARGKQDEQSRRALFAHFAAFDTDNSGEVSARELQASFAAYNRELKKKGKATLKERVAEEQGRTVDAEIERIRNTQPEMIPVILASRGKETKELRDRLNELIKGGEDFSKPKWQPKKKGAAKADKTLKVEL